MKIKKPKIHFEVINSQGVLNSFSIKNNFYDTMDLSFFFRVTH